MGSSVAAWSGLARAKPQSFMSAWPLFSCSRLREWQDNEQRWMVTMKPRGGSDIRIGFGIPIAAQRLCCEQTVLLASASHKFRLSLSNQADSNRSTELQRCRYSFLFSCPECSRSVLIVSKNGKRISARTLS